MNRIVLAAALVMASLSLSSCALAGIPSSPQAAADATVLDEQAAIGAELAYKAFRVAAELGVDAGLITGETATKIAAIDNRAYQALQVARAAYETGNSETYFSALANARAAIAEGIALVKGDSP